jgi:hypothetical protein
VAVNADNGTTTPATVTGSGVASFENFNEGDNFKPSFTDPVSGITFSNSIMGTTASNFTIEYANSASWPAPMFQNNKYLTAGGYAPGNGASLPGQWGFTGTLPQPARTVELDLAGESLSGTYSVSFLIQNIDGVTLASQTVNFTSGPPQQYHLTQSSANVDIARFLIVPGTNGFDAADNISALVPEPTVSIGGAVGLIYALGRTLARRHPPVKGA